MPEESQASDWRRALTLFARIDAISTSERVRRDEMSASERLRRSLAASARDAADTPPPPANAPTSVAALRREIAARGLDDSECVEKADLEAVLGGA